MDNNKRIILFQFLGPNKQFFNELGADSRNEFIQVLKNDLISKGFIPQCLNNQSLKNVYAILFFDMHSVYPIYGSFLKKLQFLFLNIFRSDTSSRNLFKEEKNLKKKLPKYLIAFEPQIICPENYDSRYSELFDKTFSWSKNCCGGKSRNIKINLPIPENNFKTLNSKNFMRKKLLVTISSNKGSYKKGSLCELKYKGYEQLRQIIGNQFDLYGYMWDQSFLSWFRKFIRGTKSKYFYKLPPYFKGQVINKDEIISNYKFCLVIENMSAPSFITEKIFHPIISGSVPIYLGAPNVEKYIPSNCFIKLNDFKNWNELCKFIEKYNQNDYEKFITNREKFLKSSEFYKFTSKNFSKIITNNIVK